MQWYLLRYTWPPQIPLWFRESEGAKRGGDAEGPVNANVKDKLAAPLAVPLNTVGQYEVGRKRPPDALVPRSTRRLCSVWLGEAGRAVIANVPSR